MTTTSRPTCITCGKRLQKFVRQLYVPHDVEDPVAFLRDQNAWRGELDVLDPLERIRERQADQARRYRDRRGIVDQARRELELLEHQGANEPTSGTIQDRNRRHRLEDTARQDPKPTDYQVRVRCWIRGEYGPDGAGLFHAGTCAQRWAIKVAGELRRKGRI